MTAPTQQPAEAPAAPLPKQGGNSPVILADAFGASSAGLGPRDVHPWHRPAQPSHEDMKASPNRPVFVTANPMAGSQTFDGSTDPARELPVNARAMEIDTDIFAGRIEIHLRGLKTTRGAIFEGKKRFFQVVIQGRFKREVDAAAVCIGQEFVKPGNVPAWVGELVLSAAAKVFSSSAHVQFGASETLPHFMNPVLAACQMVNVSRLGSEPADMWAAGEDLRLLCPELVDKAGRPASAEKRRKWCDVPRNLEGRVFTPDMVFTLHIWQNLIDFSSYKLSVGGFVNLDLAAALNAQPLQLTCKDIKSQEYIFSMLVWHERLLYDEATWSAAANLASRFSSVGNGIRGLFGMGRAA